MAQSMFVDLVYIESVDSVVSIHDSSSSFDQSAIHPPTSIKEKPSNMGISKITDKDSWFSKSK